MRQIRNPVKQFGFLSVCITTNPLGNAKVFQGQVHPRKKKQPIRSAWQNSVAGGRKTE